MCGGHALAEVAPGWWEVRSSMIKLGKNWWGFVDYTVKVLEFKSACKYSLMNDDNDDNDDNNEDDDDDDKNDNDEEEEEDADWNGDDEDDNDNVSLLQSQLTSHC
jgi:hypothetical protein